MVRPRIVNPGVQKDPLKKNPLDELLKRRREIPKTGVEDIIKGSAARELTPKSKLLPWLQDSAGESAQTPSVSPTPNIPGTANVPTTAEATKSAPLRTGFASKPDYKLPGPDGKLGTEDDEINPKYRSGKTASAMVGASMGSQLAAKRGADIYGQLASALVGGIAGILNPELAGQQRYEQDVAKYYADTEASIKLKKLEDEDKLRKARVDNINARTAAIQAKEQEKDANRRLVLSRSSAALLVNQYKSGQVFAEDSQEFTDKAKAELAEIYMTSAGKSKEEAISEVNALSLDRVMFELGNWAVDPSSKAYKANNGRWYRNSVTGTPLEVTGADGSTFVDAYDQNRIMAQAAAFEDETLKAAVKEITAEERADLYKQAIAIAESKSQARTTKTGSYTPDSAYIIRNMFDALLVEKAREKNPGLRNIEYKFTLPDGTVINSKSVKAMSMAVQAGPVAQTAGTGAVRTSQVVDNSGQMQADFFEAVTAEKVAFKAPPANTVDAAGWTAIQRDVQSRYIPDGTPGSEVYKESIATNISNINTELGELRAKRTKTKEDIARIQALTIMNRRFQHLDYALHGKLPEPKVSDATRSAKGFVDNYRTLRQRASLGLLVGEELGEYEKVIAETAGEKPLSLAWRNRDGSTGSPFSGDPEWTPDSVGNEVVWSAEITEPSLVQALDEAYNANKSAYPALTLLNVGHMPNSRLVRYEVKNQDGTTRNIYKIAYSTRFK